MVLLQTKETWYASHRQWNWVYFVIKAFISRRNLASTLTPNNSTCYVNATSLFFFQVKVPASISLAPLSLERHINLKEATAQQFPFPLHSESIDDMACVHVDYFYIPTCLPIDFQPSLSTFENNYLRYLLISSFGVRILPYLPSPPQFPAPLWANTVFFLISQTYSTVKSRTELWCRP